MKKIKFKQEKGITLIALIITIIIMLILVAVSINIIIKSDLFGAAQNAEDKTQTAYEKEGHDWKRTGDDLTCKCNQCTEEGSNSEGRTVTIGQQLKYEDKGKGTASITAEEAGGEEKTITKDSDTKWVVLGCKDTDNNGTNETLLITTKEPTTDEITLYGAAAYNVCGEGENNIIDRMCRDLYGDEARGMRIEDVDDCLTYTPKGGMYYDASGNLKQFSNFTTKLNSLGDQWESIQGYTDSEGKLYTPKHPNGVVVADDSSIITELGEYKINGYWYEVSSDGTYLVNQANTNDVSNTITEVEKNLIFGSSNEYDYWLASRGVCARAICMQFGPGAVDYGRVNPFFNYFSSFGYSLDYGLALRAVVSLTSDIPAAVETK